MGCALNRPLVLSNMDVGSQPPPHSSVSNDEKDSTSTELEGPVTSHVVSAM